MNTGEIILQDILKNPEDDGIRLIYADWLEEHGQELHAEFIRVQIDNFHRSNQGKDSYLVHAVGNRELEILNIFPDFLRLDSEELDDYGWNGTGSTDVEYDSGMKVIFRRGFITEVHGTHDAFIEYARDWQKIHPIERYVCVDKECFSSAWLGQLNITYAFLGREVCDSMGHISYKVGDLMEKAGAELIHYSNYIYYGSDTFNKLKDYLNKAFLLYAKS